MLLAIPALQELIVDQEAEDEGEEYSGSGPGSFQVAYAVNEGLDRVGTIRIVSPQAANSPLDVPFAQEGSEADLRLFASAPPVTLPGEDVEVELEVSNLGPHPAKNVRVLTQLPVEFFDPQSIGCIEDPVGETECSLGDLAAGGTATFAITHPGLEEVGIILDLIATVESDTEEPNPADNTVELGILIGTILDIPTLDRTGILALTGVLALAALLALRRRRRLS